MKMGSHIGISAVILLLPLLISDCSDSENRHLAMLNQAKVVIDLGMPKEHASAGLMDKILRVFARDAIAQSAPATFGQIKVRVTGLDIGTIEKEFGGSDVITMNVKAGDLRQFEVIAFVAPGDPSAAASFRGTAAATLPAGSTVSVFVKMGLYETKIVVPDYSGQKIAMMDPATGQILASRNASDIFGTTYSLRPYDIDFDSRGRIFLANNTGAASRIFRMDNINSTLSSGSCVEIAADATGIRSISIDKKRNILYYSNYATPFTIYKISLEGGAPQLVTSYPSGYNISAICVDEGSGYIYFNVSYSLGPGSAHNILVYDPNAATPGLLSFSYASGYATTFDLIVKGGFLYASYTNYNYISNVLTDIPKIARLPLNLDTVTTPVVYLTGQPGGSAFIGPREFLAVPNRKLYIIDEDVGDITNTNELIASFIDISGSGWTTYPNNPEIFQFYGMC